MNNEINQKNITTQQHIVKQVKKIQINGGIYHVCELKKLMSKDIKFQIDLPVVRNLTQNFNRFFFGNGKVILKSIQKCAEKGKSLEE